MAEDKVATTIRQHGASVDDCVLYRNEIIEYDTKPEFDAVLFASGSAVNAFAGNWGVSALENKVSVVIGGPTGHILTKHGRRPDVVSFEATVESAILALAAWCVDKKLSAKREPGPVIQGAAQK